MSNRQYTLVIKFSETNFLISGKMIFHDSLQDTCILEFLGFDYAFNFQYNNFAAPETIELFRG